jgi:hypothetical protein
MSDEEEEKHVLPPSILNALGLDPVDRATRPEVVVPKSISGDAEKAREIIFRTLDKMDRSLDNIMDIGEASMHPSAFEKIAMLGKTIMDGAKDIMIIDEKHQKLLGGDTPAPTIGTMNNIIVSSEDMFDTIKAGLRKNKIIDG